jgi:hypothetical protein
VSDELEKFEIHKQVVSKGSFKNERASILFIKHSLYSSSYSSFEDFCQYERDVILDEGAKKREKARLAGEKKEKQKELENGNIFHSQMDNKAGKVISIKQLKEIYLIYKLFMNKTDVFMMRESQIINHRIPSKGGRILVFNIDLSNLITDKDGNPISLYLNHCRDDMKHLNLFHDYALISEGENGYCLESTAMEFQIDKLNEDEQDNHSYELELFDESYIDCEIYNLRSVFNTANPIDILIAKNKFIATQQGAIFCSNDKGIMNSNNTPADIILRSYNHHFIQHKNSPYAHSNHSIIKNGDGEFWLLSQGEYALEKQRKSGKPTSYPFKIYEHLEVLRNF